MPAKPKKDWTLLVFMAGDNNLDQEGERDLLQMKSVDLGSRINIVMQFDRAEAGRNTRRYLLRHGSSVVSDAVEILGETNTGDPAVLEDFLLWGIREYPAKRVMVVIWNHGGGADDTDDFAARRGLRRGRIRPPAPAKVRRSLFSAVRFPPPGCARRKIAVDEESGDFLDNIELKKVLTNVAAALKRPIDILGMDACLMSMVEVAWQVRGTVGFTVGSQENEPGEGWPYDTILADLAGTPAMTPAKLAETIVRRYLEHYPEETPVTQSVCDVGKLQPLVTAVDTLANALLARIGRSSFAGAVLAARRQTLQFANPDYIDLHHFCDSLCAQTGDPIIAAACGKVQAALLKATSANGSHSTPFENARGLSIYFPLAGRAPLYATLDFATGCAWGDFLKKFIPNLNPH